ncbi:MAG: hypothetical protein U0354_09190 [Candidatus Sericytochromatia bacterium]
MILVKIITILIITLKSINNDKNNIYKLNNLKTQESLLEESKYEPIKNNLNISATRKMSL